MRKRHLWLLPIGILLLLIVGYLGMSVYYCSGFSYGTWINGIYCTGKSAAEVNALLIEGTNVENLHIIDEDGTVCEIAAEKIGYTVDYQSQLERYLRKQNPLLWIHSLFQKEEIALQPQATYDEQLLKKAIGATSIAESAQNRKRKVEIYRGENGYELYNGMNHVLNLEMVLELAKQSMEDGSFQVVLGESGCYEDLPLTGEMQATLALFEKVEAFQQCGIVYDMGDAWIPLEPAVTADWITLDEAGGFVLDAEGQLVLREDGIREFIADLAREYDTYGSTRSFQATRGETVEIQGGTYGNQLDQKKEIKYLTQAFLDRVSEVRVPAYKKEAYVRGKKDIGDTYIEIDMTNQKMYFYEKGQLKIETDVVTGDMRKGYDTPSGVNFVYNKQRNRVLRGKDYASFVNYWMPVKGNIGIHDASWRKKFGGEIYLKNGSHGYINTPYDAMKELYESVEIGMPVVMFY